MAEQIGFKKGWHAGKPWHVFPVNDIKPHDTEGPACHCIPTIHDHADGVILILHNSFDGREWSDPEYPRLN